MLGRLRMDVDACIDKYLELSAQAFQPKRSRANVFAKAKDLWHADGAYRADCLETQIKTIAQQYANDPDARLLDAHSETSCKM